MNVKELSPVFIVLIKSLLFHFRSVKGNTENIERIVLKREKMNKTIIRK